MKHIKHTAARTFAGFLAAVLSAGMLAVSSGAVFAEESTTQSNTFDDGTLTYTITDGTNVSVTGCATSATHVSIMPEIDGYNVTAIGEEAFAECESLQGLTIPETVQSIGSAAFYGCTSLESLTIPDAVTKIEDGTFFNCTSLKDLKLGDDVTEIGSMAFGYCTSLEEVTLPSALETIGDQLFYYCTALQEVSIPAHVTQLGSYTFYGCMSMESFDVPATLEDIGALPFFGCRSLKTLTVEDGNPNYIVDDNVLYNKAHDILYAYPAGREDTSFEVPEGTLVVYAGAFFAAENLQQVTFHDDLQYIGEMAFDFCSGLQSITIPESVTTIGETAFSDCSALKEVTFVGAEDEDTVEKNLEIGSYAFFCCDSLKEVTLPKRVSSIGDYAFGCVSVESDSSEDSSSGSSSDDMQVEAMDDFLLIGYTGAAADYVKKCDVKINFKSLNFDWGRLVFYVVLCAAILVVLLIAVQVIRRTIMTREEKEALRQAKELQKIPLSQRGENGAAEAAEEPDDGYRGILEDNGPEEDVAVPEYDDTYTHGRLHQIGHADQPEPPAESDGENDTKED